MTVDINAAQRQAKPKFASALFVRCPPTLPAAVAYAADRAMTNASAYIRGAVLEQLRRDCIDPAQFERAAE